MKVACVLLSAVLAACALTATAKKPWFCHDLDCPEYTVGESNEDYEVRTYAKGAFSSDNYAAGYNLCTSCEASGTPYI